MRVTPIVEIYCFKMRLYHMSGRLNVIAVGRLVETTARIEKLILYSRKHHFFLIHLFKINNSKVV